MLNGLTEQELQKHLESVYKVGKPKKVVELRFDSRKERDEFAVKLSKWQPNSNK